MTLKYQSQTYQTDLHPMSIATGDFNRDSIIDLAITNFESHTVSVLLGNRNGTFQIQQILSTGNGSGPQKVVTTDFDNDSFLDLAVTLSIEKRIVIYFGTSETNLFHSPPYNFSYYAYRYPPDLIEVSDLNLDGFVDLIVTQNANMTNIPKKLICFLNDGSGCQFKIANYFQYYFEDTENIIDIVIGDFNKDGIGNSDPYTGLTRTGMTNEYPSKMIKGRFNDDQSDDVAVISFRLNTLQIQFGFGQGNFFTQIYLTDIYPTSMAVINFNKDGIDDLAILHCNGTVSVFLALKIGILDRHYLSFSNYTTTNGKCAQSLKVIDLNQDGRDDVVFVDPEMNVIRLLLGSPCDE
ncbi:unnamed protein product [Adineta ricciae]|uniref:VCBS repeat-containing protein n=1 Tax=Adineta ricciae TaxID=249248 RepID=A0A815NKG6_ADIRI|nr:unnamed protein product [Adineta ricciae]